MASLQEKVKELAEIAALVPDNLQLVCFDLLLRHYLAGLSTEPLPAKKQAEPEGAEGAGIVKSTEVSPKTVEDAAKAQADVTMADLHVKARKFMEKHAVTIGELNNLFYKEGATILPLYEDLKTTRMSEAQIRVTLLQSLRSALVDGDFIAQVESVRTECRDRKVLDGANFAANYKNNTSLFDFDKYDKETKSVRLSEDGKRELGQLIKELQ